MGFSKISLRKICENSSILINKTKFLDPPVPGPAPKLFGSSTLDRSQNFTVKIIEYGEFKIKNLDIQFFNFWYYTISMEYWLKNYFLISWGKKCNMAYYLILITFMQFSFEKKQPFFGSLHFQIKMEEDWREIFF
jgi:hypothetical protein